jgi:DNA-binding GntR family transcriptional regulator
MQACHATLPETMRPMSRDIDQRIMEAVLAGRLSPGSRLGEQQLASLFEVSRTLAREALIRLAVRRIVRVSARRGWFVAEPSLAEARETLEARCALEYGMLAVGTPPGPAGIARLRGHLRHEQRLLAAGNVAERSFQLGNFHVHLAEVLGNAVAAEMLRDLTARTMLISALYQTPRDAAASAQEHVLVVEALAAGQMLQAATIMRDHLRHVAIMLQSVPVTDPLAALRHALSPGGTLSRPAPAAPPRASRNQMSFTEQE